MIRTGLCVLMFLVITGSAIPQGYYLLKAGGEFTHVNSTGFSDKKLEQKGNFTGFKVGFGASILFSFSYGSTEMEDKYFVGKKNKVGLYNFILGMEPLTDGTLRGPELRPVLEMSIGWVSGDRDLSGSYGSLSAGGEMLYPISETLLFNVRAQLHFGMMYLAGGNVFDETGVRLTSGPQMSIGLVSWF